MPALRNLVIHAEVEAGVLRHIAFEEALKEAQERRLPVIAVFNGTPLRANPSDTIVMVAERWQAESDRYRSNG